MKLQLALIRNLFVGRLASTSHLPTRPLRGPTHEHIKIAKDGATHTALIGTTAYGKGGIPPGGHRPKTTVEFEE